MRDFRRLQTDPPHGISGAPESDNIMSWNAVIFGPEDTPWDGGKKNKYIKSHSHTVFLIPPPTRTL